MQVAPESEDELRFGQALDALLRQLALGIVRDGEGARRVGRVVVRGGHGDSVERAARAVANSPLVKAALHGGDPELGPDRAGGRAWRCPAPRRWRSTSRSRACRSAPRGGAIPFDAGGAGRRRSARDEVEYVVGLPGDGHETEVFFSDLSHEYVTINAEYTT